MEHDLRTTTTLLKDWRNGDMEASERLIGRVYSDLRRLAAHYLKSEKPGNTLQPTALVHELYLRLVGSEPVTWQNRAHFFAVAAKQLRRILIDNARARRADKRGGGAVRVEFDQVNASSEPRGEDLLALDQALNALAELDPRSAEVVELRYFGGLEEKEAAEVLGISVATLKRDWDFAKAWLLSQLRSE